MLAIALIALLAAVDPIQESVENLETQIVHAEEYETQEDRECFEEIVFEDVATEENSMAEEAIAFDEE